MKTAPHDPNDPRVIRTRADYAPDPPTPWWHRYGATLLVVLIAVSVIVTTVVFG